MQHFAAVEGSDDKAVESVFNMIGKMQKRAVAVTLGYNEVEASILVYEM